MPVPLSISELSTTPGSNSPSGADSPSVLDDHQRTAYAFIKTLSDEKAAAADAVLLTGNQTVAGIKTFSSPIAGSVTGSAASVSGTVAIANGGTGATTAAAAFTAIKQAATETSSGVFETSTDAEAIAGSSDAVAITPLKLRSAFNASGSAPVYACRAWVNFNGTGVVAIRASGNVSSITDVGIGTYTINLTTALPDANYAANVTVGNPTVGTHGGEIKSDGVSASAMNIFTYGGGSVADFPVVCVAIFR